MLILCKKYIFEVKLFFPYIILRDFTFTWFITYFIFNTWTIKLNYPINSPRNENKARHLEKNSYVKYFLQFQKTSVNERTP